LEKFSHTDSHTEYGGSPYDNRAVEFSSELIYLLNCFIFD